MTYFIVLAIRLTNEPTLMPSIRIIGHTSPVRSGLGIISQHQAVWLRQLRAALTEPVSSCCDCLPSNQLMNCSSSRALAKSGRFLVCVLAHLGQRHLGVPAAVLLHFCSLV